MPNLNIESDQPSSASTLSPSVISLRGVRVHNLKSIDLDLERGRLFVLCGVSGSGKTSLALDTLYAEGQRRYIESFSAYTRQFLERLDKPEAESIEGIPPAIAVTRTQPSLSSRSTVGTATESVEYLRLLFSKVAKARCSKCRNAITQDTPSSIVRSIEELPTGARLMIATKPRRSEQSDDCLGREELLEQGFARVRLGDHVLPLADVSDAESSQWASVSVIVDRLIAGQTPSKRVQETIETALRLGFGQCELLVEGTGDNKPEHNNGSNGEPPLNRSVESIDGRDWQISRFSSALECGQCGVALPEPQPRLFSFNSPLGACPECEGFGSIFEPDIQLIVPDTSKSLSDGAIACWTSKAYSREMQALTKLAVDHDIRLNVPFRELDERELALLHAGIPDTDFSGIDGFFKWLEKSAFKTHHRAFLSRWRSERTCPTCQSSRLREEAQAFEIDSKSISAYCQQEITQTLNDFEQLSLEADEEIIAADILQQIVSRLRFLKEVGLGYLTLDRPLRTLSGGEAQRVALTSALGSTLVNMLYILDEPTVGLHPEDVTRLQRSIFDLRDRGNTVVVVEHEPAIINAADEVIEIGPGAGDGGGAVVFQGDPKELIDTSETSTADFLTGRRGATLPHRRREPKHGRIRLNGLAATT